MFADGTHVRAGGGFGIIVSRSKTHYGVKFGSGEVVYYPHAEVEI